MTSSNSDPLAVVSADHRRAAEEALRRLGYAKVRPTSRGALTAPEFWVQESGVPRRTFPVFVEPVNRERAPVRLDEWMKTSDSRRLSGHRAIVVVPTDRAAEDAWQFVRSQKDGVLDSELSILVVPERENLVVAPHWHARLAEPKELLRLATGIVVGLFRRAQATEGSAQIDFEELIDMMRTRFRIDVHRSLRVSSDEDALFILYQLALRDSYAPGDPGANLHLLVLRPTGSAARLPWFAG